MVDNFIIAIKIDTTHSGYVWSVTTRGEEIDPYLKTWGEEVGLESPTTPTCILFDEHEQFISFGYVAKQSYLSIRGQQARDMFFFDCFKFLYSKVSMIFVLLQNKIFTIKQIIPLLFQCTYRI